MAQITFAANPDKMYSARLLNDKSSEEDIGIRETLKLPQKQLKHNGINCLYFCVTRVGSENNPLKVEDSQLNVLMASGDYMLLSAKELKKENKENK